MRRKSSGWDRKKQRRVFKNDEIKAHKIMLIWEDGKQGWVVLRAKALLLAEQAWLDLVQVSYDPKTQVATAKIIDYGKYMYDKQKEENEKKKAQSHKWQKEVKFGYNIWENDLELKIKKAQELLQKWFTVKVMVVLRWREKVYKESVREKILYVEEQLLEYGRSQWVRNEMFGFTLVLMAKRQRTNGKSKTKDQ